jgi:tricorn protease-like protein
LAPGIAHPTFGGARPPSAGIKAPHTAKLATRETAKPVANTATSHSMSTPAYLRFPTLQGDNVAFVCDDDLWHVSAGGGLARRLTAGLSEPTTPSLSPDGQWLAFIGRDEQHPEVYVMPAEGGAAKRLTWLGPDTAVRGWTPQGQILFVSTHGQPFFRNMRAYTIAPEGGPPQMLPLGQVNHLAFGPGQQRVIGRNTADRRAGNVTVAAPPGICGSTPTAPASSGA